MPIYVFLKDAPCGAKKGYKLHLHPDGKYHVHDKVNFKGWVPYEPHIVEDNPEWFEKYNPIQKVNGDFYLDSTGAIKFEECTNGRWTLEKKV